MSYPRRDFVKFGIMGVASALIPIPVFANFLPSASPPLAVTDLEAALALAGEGKALRLAGDYVQAEVKYRSAIQLVPHDIRFYDGLKKVLGAQRNKAIEIADLYYDAYQQNPDLATFASRLARVYLDLEKGNKSAAQVLKAEKNIDSLSEEAYNLYIQAIQLDSDNRDYPIEANKLQELISLNAFNVNARDNDGLKQRRKTNQIANKERIRNLSKAEILAELERIENKERRPVEGEEQEVREKNIIRIKKQLYKRLIRIYIRRAREDRAIMAAQELHTISEQDANSYGILKRTLRKFNRWDDLVELARERYQASPSFWTALGLIKSLKKRYNKNGHDSQDLTEAVSVANEALSFPHLAVNENVHLLLVQAKIYTKQDSFIAAENNFETVASILVEELVYSPDLINSYFTFLSLYQIERRNYTQAEQLINIALDRPNTQPLPSYTAIQNQKREEETRHKETLEVTLAKLFIKNNDGRLQAQLQHILSLYPENKFALKRLNQM